MAGGVYMLLRRWMEEGMKTPVAQVGQMAYQLVARGVLGVIQSENPEDQRVEQCQHNRRQHGCQKAATQTEAIHKLRRQPDHQAI